MSTDSSLRRPEANETLVEAPQIQVSPEGAEKLLEESDNPRTPRRLIERARKQRGVIHNEDIAGLQGKC